MPIQAVIFDFGDVLVRAETTAGREKWEQRLGLSDGQLPREVYGSGVAERAMVGQATVDEVWEDIAKRFNLDEEQLEELQREFFSDYRLDHKLVEFVKNLPKRYRTAILSDAWPGTRQSFAEWFGLDEVFEQMVISAEEGIVKPDPRIFEIVLRRLGVPAQQAVFVDDKPCNVKGAREVGMCAVQFKNTEQVLAELQRYLDDQSDQKRIK